ncbi:MAG: hypothetical protein K2Q18_09345 [Bdellovibrionales bacterium]|nr:hypothetical protein [Bdellovibrionales bacterium]
MSRHYPGSFFITCNNQIPELELLPLGIFEFQDDIGDLKILPNFLDIIQEIAPLTFKNFKKDFLKAAVIEEEFTTHPPYDWYDSILLPPTGCDVNLGAVSRDDPKNITVSKLFWKKLSKTNQQFLLFEVFIRNYLTINLSSSDYRRFSLYIATGKFRDFTDEQKIIFLRYFGIKEFNNFGVSIDINRELIFYEDTNTLRAGYPFLEARFENAVLNPTKFVSFRKNGAVSGVSTTTPFTRVVNDQTLSFVTPADQYPTLSEDPRFYPRTSFFPNGDVESSLMLPVDHLFNIVTEIKKPLFGGKIFFKINFFPGYRPSFFQSYPGKIVLFNRLYETSYILWWENGNPKEVGFSKKYSFNLPNEGLTDVLYLFLNEDGKVTGRGL